MQQTQTQNFHNPRLSTSSHSSLSAATNALLNGILPYPRFSQASVTAPTLPSNLTPNQLKEFQKSNQQFKRAKKIKQTSLVICLTIVLALFLLLAIEFGSRVVKNPSANLHLIDGNQTSNRTNESSLPPLRAFFTCIWVYNGLLFLNCFLVHSIAIQRRSRRGRTTAVFLREFLGVFDNQKSSSHNTILDFLLKTSFLCILWYLSCYLLFRAMSVLIPVEMIILYSMTITFRQLLGWIFLHEQFIGNKIIAYILAFSALLCLAHNDGFRFNTYLLSLSMITVAVGLSTSFDVLIHHFVKDLDHVKFRIAMINVCLFGTCCFWPLVLLLSFTHIEHIEVTNIRWLPTLITLTSALIYSVLTIVISFKYSSFANVACFLLVVPSVSLIDRYFLASRHSSLVIAAIICSFAGVFLSMIPKEWFQGNETSKMKHAFGLIHKDSHHTTTGPSTGSGGAGTTTTGTSSAFDEIRAQRRIRNALLYNEGKN